MAVKQRICDINWFSPESFRGICQQKELYYSFKECFVALIDAVFDSTQFVVNSHRNGMSLKSCEFVSAERIEIQLIVKLIFTWFIELVPCWECSVNGAGLITISSL